VPVVQVICRQQFQLGIGLDHGALVGTGKIDSAVRRGNGAGAARDPRRFFFVDQFAVGQRPAADELQAAAAIDVIADDDRRACRRLPRRGFAISHASCSRPLCRSDRPRCRADLPALRRRKEVPPHKPGTIARSAPCTSRGSLRRRVARLNAAGVVDQLGFSLDVDERRRGHGVCVAWCSAPTSSCRFSCPGRAIPSIVCRG